MRRESLSGVPGDVDDPLFGDGVRLRGRFRYSGGYRRRKGRPGGADRGVGMTGGGSASGGVRGLGFQYGPDRR